MMGRGCNFRSSTMLNTHFKILVKILGDCILTAATGAKNQRHESRTDDVVDLYLRTCSPYKKNKHTHSPTIHSPT